MARFQPGSSTNYAYLLGVYRRRSAASEKELLDALRSECDHVRIRDAKIDNRGNQVAMLAPIVEEAGRRRLLQAAPLIVEYCAWPFRNSFWMHLVPRSLRALKSIGDQSVIPRLREIAAIDSTDRISIESTILTMLGEVPDRRAYKSGTAPRSPAALFIEAQATIVMAAALEKVLSDEEVIGWADGALVAMPGIPPIWLCDLGISGSKVFYDCDGVSEPTIDQRLQVLVFGYRCGRISLPEVLHRISRMAAEDLDRIEHPLSRLLRGAAREWLFQETLTTRPKSRPKWWPGRSASATDAQDLWSTPERLDPAGKMLYRRLMGIFDAIYDDAVHVREVLGAIIGQQGAPTGAGRPHR